MQSLYFYFVLKFLQIQPKLSIYTQELKGSSSLDVQGILTGYFGWMNCAGEMYFQLLPGLFVNRYVSLYFLDAWQTPG